jgi:hypothetical protein
VITILKDGEPVFEMPEEEAASLWRLAYAPEVTRQLKENVPDSDIAAAINCREGQEAAAAMVLLAKRRQQEGHTVERMILEAAMNGDGPIEVTERLVRACWEFAASSPT